MMTEQERERRELTDREGQWRDSLVLSTTVIVTFMRATLEPEERVMLSVS